MNELLKALHTARDNLRSAFRLAPPRVLEPDETSVQLEICDALNHVQIALNIAYREAEAAVGVSQGKG